MESLTLAALKSFDSSFFARSPPAAGHFFNTTRSANLFKASVFAGSCLIVSAVCRSVALCVSRAVDPRILHNECSGSATRPAMVGGGGDYDEIPTSWLVTFV